MFSIIISCVILILLKYNQLLDIVFILYRDKHLSAVHDKTLRGGFQPSTEV